MVSAGSGAASSMVATTTLTEARLAGIVAVVPGEVKSTGEVGVTTGVAVPPTVKLTVSAVAGAAPRLIV